MVTRLPSNAAPHHGVPSPSCGSHCTGRRLGLLGPLLALRAEPAGTPGFRGDSGPGDRKSLAGSSPLGSFPAEAQTHTGWGLQSRAQATCHLGRPSGEGNKQTAGCCGFCPIGAVASCPEEGSGASHCMCDSGLGQGHSPDGQCRLRDAAPGGTEAQGLGQPRCCGEGWRSGEDEQEPGRRRLGNVHHLRKAARSAPAAAGLYTVTEVPPAAVSAVARAARPGACGRRAALLGPGSQVT